MINTTYGPGGEGDPSKEFRPDWATHPGDTLGEVLRERGWSAARLARVTGRSSVLIRLILNGKANITEKVAIDLERATGVSAEFWMIRQIKYNLQLLRGAKTCSTSTPGS